MAEPVPVPSEQFPQRIGLIAGQGDFPLLLAQAARSNGVEVIVFAINGFASPAIAEHANRVHTVELGQLNHTIELMHQCGLREIAMAGRVPHTSIFQYRHFDARAMKLVARAIHRKADALLGALASEFASEGITIIDSSLFLKSLMPKEGLLTPARALTDYEQEQVTFGYPIAKVIAGQDIGQSIVVKEKMVIAVEGAEGTDECIKRAGELAGPGCVVVKVSKPRQDMRFDIPVIGPGTVKHMTRAGATALAVSANECLFLHRDQVLESANQADICIFAVS